MFLFLSYLMLILFRPATRDLPKYKENVEEEEEDNEFKENKPISTEFSDKTNQLLSYIEKTYLQGLDNTDEKGRKIIEKMKLAENSQKVKCQRQETKD